VRIRHVVTYLSEAGTYGGPLAVARNHVEQLRLRGADAQLWSGWDASPVSAASVASIDTRLFRARRFTRSFFFTVAPRLLLALARTAHDADLHHVHLGRDLVSLPSALILRLTRSPYVVQTHGMLGGSQPGLIRIFDLLLTRTALMGASRIFCLSVDEQEALAAQHPAVAGRTVVLPNGIQLFPRVERVPGTTADVVFCGRLHRRKRVLAFAAAAVLVHAESDVDVRFTVIGPDEGELDKLLRFIESSGSSDFLVYEGPLRPDRVQQRLAAASLVVMPSEREPFGMVALEALAAGVPVVLDEDTQLRAFLGDSPSVVSTRSTPRLLADAILDSLPRLESMSESAQDAVVKGGLTMEAIGERIAAEYRAVLRETGRGRDGG
jgi:glycosyltransferase involved in cell wall biosynthesis